MTRRARQLAASGLMPRKGSERNDLTATAAAIADPARLSVLRALCRDGTPASPVFDRMTRLAARLLGAPVALGTLVDTDTQLLASAFDPSSRYERGAAMPIRYSLCQYAVADRQPLVVGDATGHAQVRENPAVVEHGVRAYVGVPVMVGGHPMGTLCVLDFKPRRWSAEDVELLADLASAAATELELRQALSESNQLAESESVVRRLRAIQSVTDAALEDRPLPELLEELLRRIRAALSTDTATLLLRVGPDELEVRASLGVLQDTAGQPRVRIGRGIAGRIAQTRRPEIVHNVRQVDVVLPELRERVRSLLGVPLVRQGTVLGVLHVGTLEPREFDSEDVRLLQLVAERAAMAIERTQLHERERAALTAAEKASRAKADFLSVMSHELRTPLNAIGGYAHMLKDGVATDAAAASAWLARIIDSQRHLLRLIERILAFADLGASDEQPGTDRFTPDDLVSDVASEIAAECSARGLDFAWTGCPSGASVLADRGRATQILRELIGNAVKFTPRGGHVRIACRLDGDMVAIIVRDDGPGIPVDRLGEAFQSFVQVDQSATRRHEGIGLGLALSRAMARAMGGDVVAAQDGFAGTTVELRLPRG